MNTSSIFNAIAANSMKNIRRNEGDYIGDDGLLYCGKCHTRKQTRIEMDDGTVLTPACMCRCQIEAQEREEEEQRRRERMRSIARCRSAAFSDDSMRHCTFDADDSKDSQASRIARNYTKHFEDFMKAGKGLMFYGTVGTGKTFYASCIANALIDRCVPVLVTNFSRITNRLQSKFDGRQEFIDSLGKYDLLVIDDFAMERDTEYMNEIVYSVIDSRYRSGKPLIVTTNVSKEEFGDTSELSKQRIYSRISDMCIPVLVAGKDRRGGRCDEELIRKLLE